jgi:hypothetical protein
VVIHWTARFAEILPDVELGSENILAALSKWTNDFNSRTGGTLCDVFARDLKHDRGFQERDFNAMRSLL